MEPDSSPEENPNIPESFTDRPDGWLLREWKAGDERAAEVLFDRYAIRLVALVASRLNRSYQGSIDPNDVVQSAMGSFFDAARHSRIEVSRSVSLWRLLATFARRKMARSIERQSAVKRGGDQARHSLDSVQPQFTSEHDQDQNDEANEFIATLKAELTDDLFVIIKGILAGQTHRELAESLGIDERTVRRRLSRVREQLAPNVASTNETAHTANSPPTMPRVNYNEFVLGKLIGSGGFGKVYRASMQADGGTVAAVKFLRKAFWQNHAARRSFLNEINLASQINHPGVIRYLSYGESPHGGPYVISEWIDGHSLQDAADVTPNQIVHWLQQICDAIGAVHQAGLVHGDLTPSNVLVNANDRITIADFGFSQASIETTASAIDKPRLLGGTPGFAAPEQIDPAFGSIGPKTDIYAIGGLLHWLLYQEPPNLGVTPEESLSSTLSGLDPEVMPSEAIHSELRNILAATLRKSPSDRTATIEDILAMVGRSR
ncbi:Serine/threonine-protein kinase PknB [Rubripirellula tenax]|uniref:Serine/threonine-protein kinase PknB n=1 Tax=Rubripirellula tenax TaxID=2528015 RepID=A0A5C6E7H0_9BACT|nr:sigma-70 family RNA polymerase sigma factor [Rubripirellula tenax]TWU44748.1 Serine/threonine-protein kinase PknB [Rubripirellula tenax]